LFIKKLLIKNVNDFSRENLKFMWNSIIIDLVLGCKQRLNGVKWMR